MSAPRKVTLRCVVPGVWQTPERDAVVSSPDPRFPWTLRVEVPGKSYMVLYSSPRDLTAARADIARYRASRGW